jgi:hypothetical protein
MGNIEANYRTDENLKAIMPGTGDIAFSVNEASPWLSENLRLLPERSPHTEYKDRLRKLIAGFEVSPIR